jgi:hypothetical protein
MQNLQPLLVSRKEAATDLSLMLSSDGKDIFAFLDTALLERISCCRERLEYKILVGRMVNAGHSLTDLKHSFGHDARTMKRWGAALKSEDSEFIVRVFSGRGGAGKITPTLKKFVSARYLELREKYDSRYREKIHSEVDRYFGVELSGETLRKMFRAADCGTGGRTEKESTDCVLNCDCSTDFELERNRSTRIPGCTEPPPDVLSGGSRVVRGIHHAGLVLFIAMLEVFRRDRPHAAALQSQWVGQILQGAVNIEQSRMITAHDLARFTGTVEPGTEPQRHRLRQEADLHAVVDIYAANARLLSDGPGKGCLFYYDPHSKEYTGGLDVLKGWCGRRHGVVKVMYLDAIHTESGRPCFMQHYSPYYDLRERFFMTLEIFDRLFPPSEARDRTFVIDRGIYGLETIRLFLNSGDHLITWEKGYSNDGWEDDRKTIRFARFRSRNKADDLQRYVFKCQEGRWSRDSGVRRIVVRATNPNGATAEVSVLCTHPDIDIERIVWAIFNRWLQENDFKYLDKHFGINQLTSYASTTYAKKADSLEDRQIESSEHRQMAKKLRNCEAALARLLLQQRKTRRRLAKAEADIEILDLKIAAQGDKTKTANGKELRKQRGRHRQSRTTATKRLNELEDKILTAEDGAEQMRSDLAGMLKNTSRLQSLIDQNYRMLDVRAKAYFDALRIVAANMFRNLLQHFRPIHDNHRNDHAMLRQLTRADGFVREVDGIIHIDLWLKGRFQKKQRTAFNAFLAECTDEINQHFAGRAKPVRISVPDSPPSW